MVSRVSVAPLASMRTASRTLSAESPNFLDEDGVQNVSGGEG
jgi:hypothetical protein